MTNYLRGIHNSWHFHYAVVSVLKLVCGSFSIALLTLLTLRYVSKVD
ncbi:DUF3265 domain-containing protein [Vibrio cholerae]|nr:DUF3265 domain-containing protein [Vibrio cholerae]TXZ65683.1 DUF3265 domain-containing protein [Vibrio cholerae]HDZ9234492.1 DUF3265 domain-containing protein [Vibrio cholerae]